MSRLRLRTARPDGDILKARRALLGLSQQQVAAAAGVKASVLHQAEDGKPVCTTVLSQVTRSLGVPLASVLRIARADIEQRLAESGFLPPSPVRPWVGRGDELQRVRTLLMGSSPRGPVCISGGQGMGKSALAASLALQLADTFPDGVAWLPRSRRGTLLRTLDTLARALGLDAGLPQQSATTPEDWLAAMRVWLADSRSEFDALGG